MRVLRSFLILFILVAGTDALAFDARGRTELTQQLRHIGHVIGQQDWTGFI